MDKKKVEFFYRKNIRYLRKLKGLTQKELGDKMGVDYSTISKWEKGDNDIDIEIATEMSIIFDVKAYHFLYVDIENYNGDYKGFEPLIDEYNITAIDEKQLIDAYRSLTSESRKEATDYIKFLLHKQNE